MAAEDQFTIAVFGFLNPAILSESWLRRSTDLFDEKTEFIGVEHDAALVVFALDDVHVEVTPERFLVNSPRSSATRAQEIALAVFATLNHTPIEVVGVYLEREVTPRPGQDALEELVDRGQWSARLGRRVALRQIAISLEEDDGLEGRVHIEDSMINPGDLYLGVVLQASLPDTTAPTDLQPELEATFARLLGAADHLLEGMGSWSSVYET